MLRRFLAVIGLILIPIISSAKYVQTCSVKYATQEGWSKYYTVDVTFLTGGELNQATQTFDYQQFDVYAVIFWGESKTTMILIKDSLICGSEVDKNCISSQLSDLKGKDKKGVQWKVCVTNFCY